MLSRECVLLAAAVRNACALLRAQVWNLSSRRGRPDDSADYKKVTAAHLFHDLPYEAGGNPVQGAQARRLRFNLLE